MASYPVDFQVTQKQLVAMINARAREMGTVKNTTIIPADPTACERITVVISFPFHDPLWTNDKLPGWMERRGVTEDKSDDCPYDLNSGPFDEYYTLEIENIWGTKFTLSYADPTKHNCVGESISECYFDDGWSTSYNHPDLLLRLFVAALTEGEWSDEWQGPKEEFFHDPMGDASP